jgi:hypothetical protein
MIRNRGKKKKSNSRESNPKETTNQNFSGFREKPKFDDARIKSNEGKINQFKIRHRKKMSNISSLTDKLPSHQHENVSKGKRSNNLRFKRPKNYLEKKLNKRKAMTTQEFKRPSFAPAAELKGNLSHKASQESKELNCLKPGGYCFEYHIKKETEQRVKNMILDSIRKKLKNVDLCSSMTKDDILHFKLDLDTKDTKHEEYPIATMRKMYQRTLDSKFKILNEVKIRRKEVNKRIETIRKKIKVNYMRLTKGKERYEQRLDENEWRRNQSQFKRRSHRNLEEDFLKLDPMRKDFRREREDERRYLDRNIFIGKRRGPDPQFRRIRPEKDSSESSQFIDPKNRKLF